ncbi:MAG: PRC-barrel domain-containing protein [Opitutus sp.]
MKSNLTRPLVFSTLSLAVVLTAATPAFAEPSSSSPSHRQGNTLASLYPHGRRAADLVGMNVRGSSGEDLGRVDNLVIDTSTGDVVYAIVSSGGVLGLGDTLRAVPFRALNYVSDKQTALTVKSSLAQWKSAPVYVENHLAELAGDAQAGSIFEYYGQTWPTVSTSQTGSAKPRHLQFSKELADADVHAGDRSIGQVEDLVIDQAQGKAAVLLDPDDAFAGGTNKYVIPFSQLAARIGDDETLTTNLTAEDFRSAAKLDNDWSSGGAKSIYIWSVDTGKQAAE